jgi:hypothetical protein
VATVPQEQFGTATCYFGGSASTVWIHLVGCGTEYISSSGALGGGSFTRIFENDILPDDMPSAMTLSMSRPRY